MASPISIPSTQSIEEIAKRLDSGLGLSESPPPQQMMHRQEEHTRPRNVSTCTDDSIQSTSSTSSTRSRFHEGMLMPDATPDPSAKARHAYYRRRVRQQVFNEVHLDWKSAPVLCDERYDYASLLYRPGLRCTASPQYLLEVQDTIRRQNTADAVVRDSGSESTTTVVCIDGEEMIDMIG
ncbi:hypothetical protein CBER1_04840 [Cercospora berteroae]|uniref:Uncharacterized protein n=1 Tax=Cercospora berteroae TaxID=357750 RepID=A0A2S6BRQ0_9PEZI|nr:hypothetical protein CBER1_04840 [Cercospora berteroae]